MTTGAASSRFELDFLALAVYDAGRDKLRSAPSNGEPAKKPGGSLVPVAVVLVCLAGFVVVVVSCAGVAGVLALGVVAAIGGIMVLHYLVWGHWLKAALRNEAQRSAVQSEDEPSRRA